MARRKNKVRLYDVRIHRLVYLGWMLVGEETGRARKWQTWKGDFGSWEAVRVFDKCLGDIEYISICLIAPCWNASQDYICEKRPKVSGCEIYINFVKV
jgi:hypothetical protein